MAVALTIIGILVFFVVILLASAIRVLREYERGVIFRLGRLIDQKGPGLIFLIPIIDKMVRVDLRTVTLNVPPQEVITRDNVPASVNAVCYFKVVNASDSIVQVENYLSATSQIAQTTLRAVLGRAELDTLLSERDRLNDELQRIIDDQTEPWGIKVTTVEIKDVEIPQTMQRAMARQAEAERERRAKIIAAEGEFQAADKLAQAAAMIGAEPVAIQLRYLQTLLEIGSEHNSTTIFPLPIDLITPFLESRAAARGQAADLSGSRPSYESTRSRVCGSCWPRRARTGRSASSRPTTHDAAREECPLCEGHESWTPPETYALRPGGGPPDSPGWLVRAVPNKYPLLEPGGRRRSSTRLDASRGDPELFVATQRRPAHHEVIVHAPAARGLDDRARRRSSSATRWRAGAQRSAAHAQAPRTCT